MKYVKTTAALLLAILSFEISTYSQTKKKTDAEERELFGPVKEVRLTRKLIMSSDAEKEYGGGWIPGFAAFNRNGYLEKFEAFDDKGEYQYKIVCQFNSLAQKIEEIETKSNGERSRKRTFAYDKNGNQTEMNDYYGEEDKYSNGFRWTYDSEGNETGFTLLDAENKISSAAAKSRDENGESTVYYDAKGTIVSRELQTVGKSGNLRNEEFKSMDVNGNVSTKYIITTDEKGNVTETHYDSEGKILSKNTYVYERDSRGNWIKEVETEWVNNARQLILQRKKETNRAITYF